MKGNVNFFDRVVFLTEEKKEDIIEDFGEHEHFRVIRHEAKKVPTQKNEVAYEPHLAVCYDFKYGARDVIREGEDGFVVTRGDQEALADRMLTIMENPQRRADLSKRAWEITERFSCERYVNNWIQLFHEVTEEKMAQKTCVLQN